MMTRGATSCHTVMQNRVAKVVSWCHRHLNLIECLAVSTPVFSRVSRSLALFLFFALYSRHMNSTMETLYNSPLRRWYYFCGTIWFKGYHCDRVNTCFIFLYKRIFCSSLPFRVTLQALWSLSFLSSFCPLFLLFFFNLLWIDFKKVVSPLSLMIRFSFLSSFL